jgi:hypothetical protein
MTIDRLKADSLIIAALKKVKGIVDVSPVSEKDKLEIIRIEKEAEKQSLMGMGKVIPTGIMEVVACDLVYTALMDMDFEWGSPNLILKKGESVVGEEVRDSEVIARLSQQKNVWFMHKNFVVYKDKVSFPQDIMQKLCHFETPSLPTEWDILEGSEFSHCSFIYANPATPTDVFLKNSYFEGLDQWGLGTILIGVKS